jgi:hypothetical protein
MTRGSAAAVQKQGLVGPPCPACFLNSSPQLTVEGHCRTDESQIANRRWVQWRKSDHMPPSARAAPLLPDQSQPIMSNQHNGRANRHCCLLAFWTLGGRPEISTRAGLNVHFALCSRTCRSLLWNRLASRCIAWNRPIYSSGVNCRAYTAEPTAPDTGSTAPGHRPATQIFRVARERRQPRSSARCAAARRPFLRWDGPRLASSRKARNRGSPNKR